jgi:hypothetical protein
LGVNVRFPSADGGLRREQAGVVGDDVEVTVCPLVCRASLRPVAQPAEWRRVLGP